MSPGRSRYYSGRRLSDRRWWDLLDDSRLRGTLQELVLQIAGLSGAEGVLVAAQMDRELRVLASVGLSRRQLAQRMAARVQLPLVPGFIFSTGRQSSFSADLSLLARRMGFSSYLGMVFQCLVADDQKTIPAVVELYFRSPAEEWRHSRVQLVNWREQVRHVIDESIGRLLVMQQKRRSELWGQLSQAVAKNLPMKELYRLLEKQLNEVVRPQNLIIALADESQRRFRVAFARRSGRSTRLPWFSMGGGLGTVVWETGKSILTDDYLAECRRRGIKPQGEKAKSWLGVPLKAGARSLGVLMIWDNRSGRAYDRDTLDFVESLASQLSLGLENDRIVKDSRRQLAEMAALNRIGQEISKVMELDRLWPVLHHQIKQILDASNFYVARYRSKEGEVFFTYEVVAGRRMPPATRKVSGGLTEYIIRKKQPLLLLGEPGTRTIKLPPGVKAMGRPAASWLGVPIIAKGRVLGVMAVQSYHDPEAYNRRHLELMMTVASQAATAIENSQLYQEAQQQLREIKSLFQVGQEVVRGQDLSSLSHRLLEIIKEGFGYLNCALLLADDQGQYLEVASATGYPRNIIGTRMAVGKEGITGWAADLRQTIYVPDVLRDKHYIMGSSACRSEVALPLVSADKLLGVLDVQKKEVDGFQPREISMLEGFANQAALAIDRIRSAETVREKVQELSSLLEISKCFTMSSDFTSLLSEISDKLARGLGVTKCFLGLYHPHEQEIEVTMPEHVLKQLSAEDIRRAGELNHRTFRFPLRQNRLAYHVLKSGRPFISNRIHREAGLARKFVQFYHIKKIVIVPLTFRQKTLGLVYLADRKDGRDFSEKDIPLIEALASQAALVVDNALLYRDTSLGLKQLSTLYQMSQAITSAMKKEEVVKLGVDMVADVVPADFISIMLYDRQSGELKIAASRGLSPETVEKVRLAPGRGLAGWAAEHQQTVISPNLEKDPRFLRLDQKEGIGPAVAVPLVAKEKVLGVLNVNKRNTSKDQFTPEQIQLLSTLAGSISLALERAMLLADLDERISAQKALLDTGAMLLSTLEMDDVLKRISEAIERFIPFLGLAIYRADWDRRLLMPILGRGPFAEQIMSDPPFPIDTGITGAIALSGQAEIVPDTSKDNRAVHIAGTGEDSESILAVPMLVQGKTEAVLTLWRESSRPFLPSEMELAKLFANQAAVAWSNAKLFQEISAREAELAETNSRLNLALKRQIEVNTELSTLQYLSSTILSSLKLEEILSVVVEGIRTSLGFESVIMSLVDDSGQHLEHKAFSGLGPQEVARLQQTVVGLEEYLPLMRPEYRISNSYYLPAADKTGLADLEKASFRKAAADNAWHPGDRMIIPLYAKDKSLLAIIQIDRPANGLIPDKKKVRSLEAFGNTAVLAIENARLYNQAQNRIIELSTLYDIGLVISSVLERGELLEKVVSVIREKLHYLKVAIFLVEPQSQSLLIGGQSGYGEELRNLYFDLGGGSVVGWVAQQGQPLVIGNVAHDPRYIQADPRVKSEIAVPIIREGQTIGVLNIEDDKPNAFGDSDLRLLTTLASQVAVALDNARLYEEAKERINELQALHDVGSTVSSTLKQEALLTQVCQILEETFNYYKIAILLTNPLTNELELVASHGYGQPGGNLGRRLRIGRDGITGLVAATGQPLIVDDVTKDPHYICIDPQTRSEIAVPLTIKNRVIGVLNVESDMPGAFDRVDLRLLTTLANQVAVAVENARLYEETEQLAVTDGLTEVFNHRYFQAFLDRELSRARRYHRPLSLIMIDLDRFKSINDNYGHQVGDTVLRGVAAIIKSQARDVDLVARYGGEEFMVVLPETNKNEAQSLAERIRQAVREQRYSLPDGRAEIRVTISLGVASFPEDGADKSELVDKVDKALYRSKTEGRDRVSS